MRTQSALVGTRQRYGLDRTELAKLLRVDTVIVEIRAAEGGDDAKRLVHEQHTLYQRYCAMHCL